VSEHPHDAHDEMTAHASNDDGLDHDRLDLHESDQDTEGGMGVSSERVGPTGPGQVATTGTREVGPADHAPDTDVPPEQSSGGPERNPDEPARKSDFPSDDPRSHGDDPSHPSARREVDRRPDEPDSTR
jgi:hypothetical protein